MEPQFTEPLVAETSVQEGDECVLRVVVNGQPSPVVNFKKNGVDMEYNERVKLLQHEGGIYYVTHIRLLAYCSNYQ